MNLGDAVEAIARRVPRDDDTFVGDDGLLYCRRCNTHRQKRVTFPWGDRVVPVVCACLAEKIEQEEKAQAERDKAAAVRRYRSMGFPEREMERFTFENDDGASPAITKAMKAYVEQFDTFRKEGKGLLLYGNVGTGKTFHAGCVVNALIDRGIPCLMTSFSRLTNQINGMWEGKQAYIDSLSRFSLVAIDDLGVERDTEFMNESVTTIIDSLYRAKVPMIITSNFTPAQLTEDCEIRKRRVYDRMLERCHPIKVDGPSRRKEKGRGDYRDMNKLLGLE